MSDRSARNGTQEIGMNMNDTQIVRAEDGGEEDNVLSQEVELVIVNNMHYEVVLNTPPLISSITTEPNTVFNDLEYPRLSDDEPPTNTEIQEHNTLLVNDDNINSQTDTLSIEPILMSEWEIQGNSQNSLSSEPTFMDEREIQEINMLCGELEDPQSPICINAEDVDIDTWESILNSCDVVFYDSSENSEPLTAFEMIEIDSTLQQAVNFTPQSEEPIDSEQGSASSSFEEE